MADKTNKSYWDLLQDPKWQRRKSEILARDEWTCQECGNNEQTLHVHHKGYLKNLKPWEYEDWSLVTLCADCHKKTTHSIDKLKESLTRLEPCDVDVVRGFIDSCISAQRTNPPPFDMEPSLEYASGMAAYFIGRAAEIHEAFSGWRAEDTDVDFDVVLQFVRSTREKDGG